MAFTQLGPGTLTVTIGGGTPQEFAQEVKSCAMNHAYSEVGEASKYLDGSGDSAAETRADSFTAEADFDLSALGLYNTIFTNDMQTAEVTFTPNTAAGASWSGTAKLRLPEAVAGEAFGAKLAGSITWPFIEAVEFTPATVQP